MSWCVARTLLKIEAGEVGRFFAAPLRRIVPRGDVTMKARPGPIGSARYVIVHYRVEVNVVEVSFEIFLAFDRVFPVAALPDTAMTAPLLR